MHRYGVKATLIVVLLAAFFLLISTKPHSTTHEHQVCKCPQLSGAAADVSLGMQLGKGKWKKILDEAGDVFKSRSQVDLKDKWRNLERQGIVQAPVKAEPAAGVNTSGFCTLGMCTGVLFEGP